MERRYFDLYHAAEVGTSSDYATVQPQSDAERRGKLWYSSWRAFHNARLDPQLPDEEFMLRRWPCRQPCCVGQLGKPGLEARYAPNPSCVIASVAGGFNDWRRMKLERSADGDGDSDDDDDDAARALLTAVEEMASAVEVGHYGTIDAATDADALGDASVGYFYVVKWASQVYELDEDLCGTEWGTLEAGTSVIDAWHTNLRLKRQRWYAPNPHSVTVPVEQILHTFATMELAVLPPKRAQEVHRSAVAEGARVLSEEDFEKTLSELRARS